MPRIPDLPPYVTPEIEAALNRFVAAVSAVPEVLRLWKTSAKTRIEFWVLFDSNDREVEYRVYDREGDLLNELPDWVPINVLTYPADEVNVDLLPDGPTLYERAARATPR